MFALYLINKQCDWEYYWIFLTTAIDWSSSSRDKSPLWSVSSVAWPEPSSINFRSGIVDLLEPEPPVPFLISQKGMRSVTLSSIPVSGALLRIRGSWNAALEFMAENLRLRTKGIRWLTLRSIPVSEVSARQASRRTSSSSSETRREFVRKTDVMSDTARGTTRLWPVMLARARWSES